MVTSLGGGLKGTGVPFALIKWKTDQKYSHNPVPNKGKDRIMFNGEEKVLGKLNKLSSLIEAMINSTKRVR